MSKTFNSAHTLEVRHSRDAITRGALPKPTARTHRELVFAAAAYPVAIPKELGSWPGENQDRLLAGSRQDVHDAMPQKLSCQASTNIYRKYRLNKRRLADTQGCWANSVLLGQLATAGQSEVECEIAR